MPTQTIQPSLSLTPVETSPSLTVVSGAIPSGQKPQTQQSQYFYLRGFSDGSRGHPIGVVAFCADPSDSNRVFVSAAVTSPKDQFNRKVGVAKALGRLKSRNQWLNYSLADFERLPTADLVNHIVQYRGRYVGFNGGCAGIDWTEADDSKRAAIQNFIRQRAV